MNKDINLPLQLTKAAVKKLKIIIAKKKQPNLKLRVYINGGGCNGFQYCFTLDKKVNKDDILICKQDVMLVIDSISLQYLINGSIDYSENIEGSRFIVINPNAKTTCGCGSSFSI
ncbi:Iron-sulfur cluster insertion protein ErpA [Candidatus Profftia lariciata]|uniref:iron-sulfur cluster insertion protein ErpA n=1 Tax=Candidatus Profftia lariciata TaxID=1987921 RepID=UPI001D02FB74|nr:iron-sulfur cluster insertion protein ErpA [Candidatus Profftia lariciata]UDG81312.1 Iron-sulfur cluster insertion protein ErpA [Candidatus Profftia lariciata]